MPQAYVKKMAKEHDISLQEAEDIWEGAKKAAGDDGENTKWGVVTNIFKKMIEERSKRYKTDSKKKKS